MSEFKITKATRRGVIPLIGLYGESGTGKTMSALLVARGLVGPSGDIHMIDTESRRGSLYADVIPGGYSVLDLEPPFTPARYIDAMHAMISAGAKVIVIDSMSHEWEGMGGVLDMAGENEDRTKKSGLHNWKQPKFEHAKLVQFLLRCPIPLVVCIRAKYKSRQKKDAQNKTVIVKDEFTSPIQAEDFIFELTAHAEVLPDHSINLTKCSHPDLRKCFPAQGKPLAIEHGELIQQWCMAGGQPSAPKAKDLKALKSEFWTKTQPIHKGDKVKLEGYLHENGFLAEGLRLDDLKEVEFENLNSLAEKFV